MVQSHELTSQVHDKAARLAEALRPNSLGHYSRWRRSRKSIWHTKNIQRMS